MASTSSSIYVSAVVPSYDVFLSFRGEDTRNSFTDHLYEALVRAGLSTFRDNDEIGRGQKLNLEIERAIRESRSSIVVLSKNYANSRWCLDELVLILEQNRNFDHFVLPVFYHVDPSDVRNQRESFEIEGAKGSKWTEVNVNMWKEALREVADLTGMVCSGLETKFIADIVDTIYRKLDLKLVSIPAHLIGMENRAEDINYWLQNEQSSALVICGMRGIGKTTMAKYIYNLNKGTFEGSSFLEGIGKHCQQPHGLLGLQKQLLRDILGGKDTNLSIVGEGTFKIEKALQIKQTLIVLDDIYEHDQLAALLGTKKSHAQTKILITTRNLDIYAWFGSLSWGCRVHKLGLLNHRESLELLSFHAFGSKIPLEGFKDLAVELEQYCEGNPLALKVLGSSLFVSSADQGNKKKIMELWRNKLNSLNSFRRSKGDNLLYGVLDWLDRVDLDIPTPRRLDVYQNKNLDDILTQNSALGDIITAVEDESIQIVGIYGLGGVGKTTLAMEVAARVKNIFSNVAFTTVSQTINVEKVQKDIGEATKRIMKGEKVLIILDDVWEKLNLEELCIPCGVNHMNCKILLTSRSKDVCKKMNAHSRICVDPLPLKEAWILFKHAVGERVETDFQLKQVAIKVAKECGGLPLLIQALGNALKDKHIDSWKSALTRLTKHAPLDIDPEIRRAFTHLKLSYDYLESEEVKSCFLLCSMFPDNGFINLEHLVYYGVGLAKFNDLESMDDARDRVQNAVNILKSCGLLLNGDSAPLYRVEDEKYITKMHDVVRDVALLIASKGNNKFMVEARKGLREWLPRKNSLESYTGISLMSNKIRKLPDYELHFPRVDTFLINGNELSKIFNEFFRNMKEARVVDMACNKISSLPQSLKLLTKLRMLNLRGNKFLREISILGELKDLEILILRETGIKEIPQEIGQLVNLRRFDVSKCENMCHISPGVLLKLCWLEELCIEFSRKMQYRGIHDSLVEVMNLSKLTYLNLLVPCSYVIPEGFSCEKLNGFVIVIGSGKYHMPFLPSLSEHYLVLSTDDLKSPFLKSIKKLIELSPVSVLNSVHNLNNILPELYHEGFNKLESIRLEECRNVRCLVDWDKFQNIDIYEEYQLGDARKTEEKLCKKLKQLHLSWFSSKEDWDKVQNIDISEEHQLGDARKTEEKLCMKLKHLHLSWLSSLEVVWKCPDKYISLSNLVTLHIEWCKKLVRLFSVSVAQGLLSLQELTIRFCYCLKEVIWGGHDDETAADIIVFPSLVKISLDNLAILTRFCYGNSTIKYPTLVEVNIRRCSRMKKWGNGSQETPKLKFMDKVLLDGPYAINDAVAKSSETWDGDGDKDEDEEVAKSNRDKDEDEEVAKYNRSKRKIRKFQPHPKIGRRSMK